MEKLLLINADEPEEVRVAVVEDGKLEELYIETAVDPTGKGNIYSGRVQNVEKGIGAAFVDLGGGRTGFLHVSDLADRPEVPLGAEGGRVQDLLKPGQDLLVQISRGPVGQKGPALTTRISLPGRYVVLLANSTRSGVSRRIDHGRDRDRARDLAHDLSVPEGMGTILRTASLHRAREELEADLHSLLRLWESLQERLAEGGGPRLVHAESDLALRAVRDILPPDVTRIVVDNAETAARIREVLENLAPPAPPPAPPAAESGAPTDPPPVSEPTPIPPEAAEALDAPDAEAPAAHGAPVNGSAPAAPALAEALPARLPPPPVPVVELREGPMPLFHAFEIEPQIEEAFRRTIRLPSGGSIVIDPTEALVAIDVNSGRSTEEEDLETTAWKTDLEAVPAVARQLRLRDLGGVVVIDFIDLRDPEHIREVEAALKEALKRDRAKMRFGKMGPFGCLEMTRQRIRPALLSVTHVPCSSCSGTGRRRHPVGLALRILREIRARVARTRGQGGMEVRVEPVIADILRTRKAQALAALEAGMTGPVRLVPEPQMSHGTWSIRGIPPRAAPARPTSAESA